MNAQIENIIELAATLVVEGKATTENALEMAFGIEQRRLQGHIDAMRATTPNKTKAAVELMGRRMHRAANR